MNLTKLVSAALLCLGALGALAALAALAGCSKKSTELSAGGDARPAAVALALNWVPEPEFGGFYAARETGAFRKHGLEVEIRGGGAGVPVVQMVATGQADFGVAGADEVIVARTRGADVVPVFATFQTSPQGIMVHAARGYDTLQAAFKAGTMAVEPGLPYVAFLKKKFGGFGATIVPYDGGVARFMVDPTFGQQCFVSSEPLAARKKGGDPRVFLVAEEGFNPYTAVVIVKRSLLAEHADRVRGFVEAAREGWVAYLESPAATNAVMQRLNPSMDAETFQAAAAAEKPLVQSPGGAALGSMTRERWETLASQLVDLGVVEKAPEIGSYFLPVQ